MSCPIQINNTEYCQPGQTGILIRKQQNEILDIILLRGVYQVYTMNRCRIVYWYSHHMFLCYLSIIEYIMMPLKLLLFVFFIATILALLLLLFIALLLPDY